MTIHIDRQKNDVELETARANIKTRRLLLYVFLAACIAFGRTVAF